MCLEDLRLGRGRFRGKSAQIGAGGVVRTLMPPNGRRVALVISTDSLTTAGQTVDLYVSDDVTGTPFLSFTAGADPLLLRIEDIGIAIQEAWSANATQLVAGNLTVSEILTNQVVSPMPSEV